jgi:hypothetical protein
MQQTKWAILSHETEILNDYSTTRSGNEIPSYAATANVI